MLLMMKVLAGDNRTCDRVSRCGTLTVLAWVPQPQSLDSMAEFAVWLPAGLPASVLAVQVGLAVSPQARAHPPGSSTRLAVLCPNARARKGALRNDANDLGRAKPRRTCLETRRDCRYVSVARSVSSRLYIVRCV